MDVFGDIKILLVSPFHLMITYLLTNKLEALPLSVLADHPTYKTFKHPKKTALSHLKALEKKGHVLLYSRPVVITPPPVAPLLDWIPGKTDEPNFGALSWILKSRFNGPLTFDLFATATPALCKVMGGFNGGHGPIKVSDSQHEYWRANIFLSVLSERQQRHYISEEALKWPGERQPDAYLRKENIIIEIGGTYSSQRLESFHAAFHERHYQLW